MVQCCLSYFYLRFTEEEIKSLRARELAQVTASGGTTSSRSQIGLILESMFFTPIVFSNAMIISLPCKCSCMRCCPCSFVLSSCYAQVSFLLLLLLVPSALITMHLFETKLLFPPVLLPSSPHFYIESCRWTRGGGPYAEAHGRCNVVKKGSFLVFWSTSSFLLYPNILSLSICSCLPFHHPWSSHSGIWSGDLYNYWCLGYRSLILEVIFKNVKKEL